jgi:hypothetical protein
MWELTFMRLILMLNLDQPLSLLRLRRLPNLLPKFPRLLLPPLRLKLLKANQCRPLLPKLLLRKQLLPLPNLLK